MTVSTNDAPQANCRLCSSGYVARLYILTVKDGNCPVKSIVKNWLFADVNRSGAVSPIILAKESRTPVVIPTFAAFMTI